MHVRPLTWALITSLAFAPAVFAQDTGSTATTDTGAGGRFAVVGGYALSEPESDTGALGGAESDFGGAGAPTLSASWHVNDNLAVEAWGTEAFGHRVELDGVKTASVEAQPYALSAQYHFGPADGTLRPFVGLGYYEMNFRDEEATANGPVAGSRVGMETAQGPMATVGLDMNFSPRWFARTDVRYLHTGNTDVALDGVTVGEVETSPVVVGVGIGARF